MTKSFRSWISSGISRLTSNDADGTVTVIVSYGISADQIEDFTVTPLSADAIDSIWPLLTPHIPEANPQTHILILPDSPPDISVATELPLSSIPARPIRFRLFPTIVRCLVKTADLSHRERSINVCEPVISVIKSIVGDESESKFVLGFRGHDGISSTDNMPLQVLCPSMPLSTQNWFHEPLILIRRVCEADVPFLLDSAVREALLKNCRLAALENISFYKLDEWAKLAALQLVWEGNVEIKKQQVRSLLALCVPPVVEVSEELVDKTWSGLKEVEQFTRDQAQVWYIQKAAQDGCQCAFVTKIKFRKDRRTWGGDRYLAVSPVCIWILNELGEGPEDAARFGSWVDLSREKEVIRIVFPNKEVWNIECKSPEIVIAFLRPQFVPTDSAAFPVYRAVSVEDSGHASPVVTLAQRSDGRRPSRFAFDGEGEEGGDCRGERIEPKGAPNCVVPAKGEGETPFQGRQALRSIRVVAGLDPEAAVDVEVSGEIDAKEFFKLAPAEMWHHNTFVLSCLVCLIAYVLKRLYY
jgi:hypothetical protein